MWRDLLLGYGISVVLALVVYGYRLALSVPIYAESHFMHWRESLSIQRAVLAFAGMLWVAMALLWPVAIAMSLVYLWLNRTSEALEALEREKQQEYLQKFGSARRIDAEFTPIDFTDPAVCVVCGQRRESKA